MSVGASAPASTGPTPVDQALEPAWVRDGSAATQKSYALAQSFEEMLVQELSQSMAAAGGLGGEGASMTGESAEAAEGQAPGTSPLGSELSSLLPQALSAGIASAGGLGLAAQITRETDPPSPPAQVGESGGSKA